MKTKLPLFCGLIAVVPALIFTTCLSLTGGTRAHTHQWSEWIQVSGDDATEERACKIDSAHRQTRFTGTDRFTFEAISETAYRVRKGTLTTGEITIPAYYRPDADSEYLPVTEIGSTFDTSSPSGAFYSTSLTSIIIPDTITSIGSSAFYNCTNLTSITIPVGVTSIGIAAFLGCKSLTSLTLPASITYIDMLAFSSCESLTHINIPASVTYIDIKVFYGCTSLTGITVDRNNPYFASEGGILYNKAKTEFIAFPSASGNVTIPAGVTTIGNGAFNGCASLISITFPASVRSIEGVDNFLFSSGAFAGCDSLISVTFAEGSQLENIGNGTFYSCKSLTNITIPASVRSIGEGAFYNTAWLNSQPDGLVYAGKVLYTYKGTMPSNTVINNIRDDTIVIADYAFSGRENLTSITIPESVRSIGHFAFFDCISFTGITFAEGSQLETIGSRAFYDCTSLTSITIPESVRSISHFAFLNCRSFTGIIIPETLTTIGNGVFSRCEKLTSIMVDANNPNYASESGILYNKAKTEILAYPSASGNIIIPASVTSIGDSAFSRCASLTSITIPASVTSIGEGAFRGCTGLTNITIPTSVTSIGGAAFFEWTASQTINILSKASETAAENAWGRRWRLGNAQINYLGR